MLQFLYWPLDVDSKNAETPHKNTKRVSPLVEMFRSTASLFFETCAHWLLTYALKLPDCAHKWVINAPGLVSGDRNRRNTCHCFLRSLWWIREELQSLRSRQAALKILNSAGFYTSTLSYQTDTSLISISCLGHCSFATERWFKDQRITSDINNMW